MIKNTNNKFLKYLLTGLFIVLFSTQFKPVKAQEITAGADLYSTYVWRGVAYSGPSIQPYVELSSGGFAIGAWGSQGYDGFQEMDLYAGYSFDFGLSLGITDYYYPGTMYFDNGAHAFELNGGYGVGDLSLSANYIFAGDGSAGDDVYFELGYSAGAADLFIGAGDGWHSAAGPTPTDPDNDEFTVVNIGVGTSKDIQVTESLTIPLSGSVILNPDTEQLYIVVGLSL
ncbi:hypothetical protein NC796_10400 [Aliifodinibius sp. S!AR15-10]|uniref:TorF family putative porin n=1 Tax=Aliifodinibius sp. S!AR15-10 TaxID=2950437 RepID=UPI0028650065|nr:TorF family putative porin [Aliifodinibius sp. S!AR15-10]MDR8391552.1 hypothetical protein [Aliifodinibius sp. S!AR15-10]